LSAHVEWTLPKSTVPRLNEPGHREVIGG